ncbi:Ribosomal RNA large subunit methyltransferase J [Roseivivax jejudonensis]|uniref:Ribosomal RNA large subunit methyltransferase J n=1 Tax=Roseivivax jejudonensis TaxID=1529041 RepID=A0A1X7A1R3_9RHOB|nr:23S rRNA (adenine(2030)-N(6))-methyltransferase RlmJ [Roseivivax jejudonensis]SLN68151.1 Ribosomal RNA large subunit methyltransferase J [Roseivivax jejudonensis]
MLSYQHAYHAGNLADVHKHALLGWMLGYLTRKDKPLSYLETHAGRGRYDLSGAEATKTGEAAAGIGRAAAQFAPEHPYSRALAAVRAAHGSTAYPGSPLLAAQLLRPEDTLHLAELHPAEHAALAETMAGDGRIHVHRQDGIAMAQSLCPPTPRRGLLLCDPSWEVKRDYDDIPKALLQLHRKWNVGVLVLWYPILSEQPHRPMLRTLESALPDALRHEVRFPPVRPGHRMEGSGLFVVNPPYGLAEAAKDVARAVATASGG